MGTHDTNNYTKSQWELLPAVVVGGALSLDIGPAMEKALNAAVCDVIATEVNAASLPWSYIKTGNH